MTTCGICDEKFNKTAHSHVCCPYCSFDACRKCCETYIVEKTVATCMNNSCNKEWTRKFMVSAFTGAFISHQWKQVREKVLLDKEKALLPATQIIVEQEIEKENILKKIYQLDREIADLSRRRRNLQLELHADVVVTERKQFTRKCPVEECRGFLNTQWKCGLCNKKTCPDCHVVKDDHTDHVCNEDDLATAKLLDADTKCCPKCSTGIYKIEGCDQMWCTLCHTAFSWKTGTIETMIHNPHFYEWQRRNNGGVAPRNIGDVPCGMALNQYTADNIAREVIRVKGNCIKTDKELGNSLKRIEKLVEATLHLTHIQMPAYRLNHVEDNVKLRVAYLRNNLSEKDFQVKLQRANKMHEKKRETGDILRLFVQTSTDILARLHPAIQIAPAKNPKAVQDILDAYFQEVLHIQEYVNECFKDIAQTFGNESKMIRLYPIVGNLHEREVLITVQYQRAKKEAHVDKPTSPPIIVLN